MSDLAGGERLRFATIIRLLLSAGASDDVVENFCTLYRNETSDHPQTPIIEVGSAMDKAATEAATRAVASVMTAYGIAPGQAPQQAPPGRRDTPAKPAGTTRVYSLRVHGQKTSISLPPDLYLRAIETFGKPEALKLLVGLAESTPKKSPNRSHHIRAELNKAIAKAAVAHQPPSSVQ